MRVPHPAKSSTRPISPFAARFATGRQPFRVGARSRRDHATWHGLVSSTVSQRDRQGRHDASSRGVAKGVGCRGEVRVNPVELTHVWRRNTRQKGAPEGLTRLVAMFRPPEACGEDRDPTIAAPTRRSMPGAVQSVPAAGRSAPQETSPYRKPLWCAFANPPWLPASRVDRRARQSP